MLTPEIAPEVTIKSVAFHGSGLPRQNVQARYCSSSFGRTADYESDRVINEEWEDAKDKNPQLINRTKFRLHRVLVNWNCILLDLGLTCCKEYLGTNCLPTCQLSILKRKGEIKCCDQAAFLANPLGVGAIVHTSDDKYVFLRRTKNCCQIVDYIDRPFGYPSPHKVTLDNESGSETKNSCALVDTLYESLIRIIEAETSIPGKYLCEPELLGFAQDRSHCWTPSLEFYVKCNLDSERVYFFYSHQQRASVSNSSSIVLANCVEMSSISSLFFRGLGVGAKGAILLYRELNYH